MVDALTIFLRQVRSRSDEHRRAMDVLARAGLAGQMVAVLRQELDSMVRVIYLLTQDSDRRAALIEASVRGEKWTQPKEALNNSLSRRIGASFQEQTLRKNENRAM